MATRRMFVPASCKSEMLRSFSVNSSDGKLDLSMNLSGTCKPFSSFSGKNAATSAQAYTSARVALGRNLRSMRWPAGRRTAIFAVASSVGEARLRARLRNSSSRCTRSASRRSALSRSRRRFSSSTLSRSRRSCSKCSCSLARCRSRSNASWYSRSCCSRRCRSSACCSARATMLARCVSMSLMQDANKATAESASTLPLTEPMSWMSSMLAGRSTLKLGNSAALTALATLRPGLPETSPPQSTKFSLSISRTMSLQSTFAQKFRPSRAYSLWRNTTSSLSSRWAVDKARENEPSKKFGSAKSEP
mmetsp:Transcript_64220/g.184559  ORF Transcript_64220/g.184559 Transcript_64220/m.184559 type:complete len:305 (-) Transcript_64220:144-1058(-)